MENKIFFLHIPRTGGTTVDSILLNNFLKSSILKIYTKDEYQKNRFLSNDKLKQIKYITGHLLLDTYDPPTIYGENVSVFTFLRNPVARLHSEYIFYKTWKKQHLYEYINKNNLSFIDYIESQDKIIKYRGKNFMTRIISGKSFDCNKTPFAALAFAKRQIEKNFFFIGIQERFIESIVLLGDILKITNLLHQKRNKLERKVKNELTEDEIERTKELNQADISLYNFACDLFSKRIADKGGEFLQRVREFSFLNEKYQKISSLMMRNDGGNRTEGIILPKDSSF